MLQLSELMDKRAEFPLTVIYGTLETISSCYTYFSEIIQMVTWHSVKCHIVGYPMHIGIAMILENDVY